MERLPVLFDPPESLREGPVGELKGGLRATQPPLQRAFQEARERAADHERETVSHIYGSAFVAKEDIERQIVSRVQRLPGLPSSHLGLSILENRLDSMQPEDYMGLPEMKEEVAPFSLHEQMEARLGINANASSSSALRR